MRIFSIANFTVIFPPNQLVNNTRIFLSALPPTRSGRGMIMILGWHWQFVWCQIIM